MKKKNIMDNKLDDGLDGIFEELEGTGVLEYLSTLSDAQMEELLDSMEDDFEDMDLEEFEEYIKQVEKDNQEFLKMFKQYLLNENMEEQIIDEHITRISILINVFLLEKMKENVVDGIASIFGFFKFYMTQNNTLYSSKDVIKFRDTILLFYTYLYDIEVVEKEDIDFLNGMFNDMTEEFIKDMEM